MRSKLYSFQYGFKKARKSAKDENGKRYTQESFANAFHVSIETVKNWEQGRAIPSTETIIDLCDFFECDIGYLFGSLDCKTYDDEFICDQTGLTEDSLSILKNAYKNSCTPLPADMKNGNIVKAIDYLLKYNYSILENIGEYLTQTVTDVNVYGDFEESIPGESTHNTVTKNIRPEDIEMVDVFKIQNKLADLRVKIRSGESIPVNKLEDKTKRPIKEMW